MNERNAGGVSAEVEQAMKSARIVCGALVAAVIVYAAVAGQSIVKLYAAAMLPGPYEVPAYRAAGLSPDVGVPLAT